MANPYGLDPRDPRYQQLVAEMMRTGQIQSPMTMESQVQAEVNKPLSSGMVSGYAPAGGAAPAQNDAMRERSRSVKGQEGKIKSQRDYANMLRGRGAPKGREVGPLGVYMGPNWGESLAYLGEQALGGYMSGRADRADEALDEERTDIALAKAMAEEERYQDKLDLDTRGVLATEANSATAAAKLLQDVEQGEADRLSRERIARIGQEGQDRRDNVEMVMLDKDGNPQWSRTRFASPSPKGMMFGDGTLVDEEVWVARNDPNLTAATRSESQGTAAQQKAEYQAGMFEDALSDMDFVLDELEYDPTTGKALVDKYANMSDFTRGASSAEGQMYNAAASRVNEAALRTSTGAAAPTQEKADYMRTLVPAPWDKSSTVDFKRRSLKKINMRLRQLADGGATQAQLDSAANDAIAEVQKEELAMKKAQNRKEGDTWEDEKFRYRVSNGQIQKAPK